ncbi:MAG: helix-turn-helix transcriptional regulator [Clostridiales bacterium]|nr:helix-turn-helix transcriptional regulator [Clostridiales bacterium]
MTKYKFYDDCLFILHLNITRFRRERGWAQEQLAERAGVSVRHLANLEAPHSSAAPSFAVLCRLAYALGIEPSALIQAEPNTLQTTVS